MQKLRPDLDIGKNIQALRRKCGYTQEQVLAKMQLAGIPISKSSYAKIETNRLNIKVSELVALKNILKCGYDDFFFEVNKALHEKLRTLGVGHDFVIRPGGHNATYWANSLPYQMLFFRRWFCRQGVE